MDTKNNSGSQMACLSGMPTDGNNYVGEKSMSAPSSPVRLRRNQSFEERWLTKYNKFNQSLERMEYLDSYDDGESWCSGMSHSSMDSMEPVVPILRRPASTGNLEVMNTDTPQNPTNFTLGQNLSQTGKDINQQGRARRGLSHSMIMNWLTTKRYSGGIEQPITEAMNEDSNGESPIVEKPVTVFGTSAAGMAPPGGTAVNTGGQISAAAGAMVENEKKPRSFSFRELNAVAPSYW